VFHSSLEGLTDKDALCSGNCSEQFYTDATRPSDLGDEGRPFEVGNQVLTSSHRKAAAAIIFMENPCGIYAARLSRLEGRAWSPFGSTVLSFCNSEQFCTDAID
jgi:hypothetical protein